MCLFPIETIAYHYLMYCGLDLTIAGIFRAHLPESAQQNNTWAGQEQFHDSHKGAKYRRPTPISGIAMKVRQKRELTFHLFSSREIYARIDIPALFVTRNDIYFLLEITFFANVLIFLLLVGVFLLLLFYQLHRIIYWKGVLFFCWAPSKRNKPRCSVSCWVLF